MTDQRALKEAAKLIKSGDSDFKGGFFSKPDYPSAGNYYLKAYDIYMKQKVYSEAKTAGEKAGNAYDKANLSLKSGQSFVQAANAAYLLNQFDEVERLLQEGKVRYLEGNQALAAIRAIREMAQKIRPTDPKVAYNLYDEALTLTEESNNYSWEKDTFLDFAVLALSMGKVPEVFQCWKRAEKAFMALNNTDAAAHCICSAIAIHLQRGDIVAAEKLFDEAMQQDYFVRTEDFSMIDMIIRGVKNNDGDIIELGQKNIIIQFLKPEIARIICSFKGPKSQPVAAEAKKDNAAQPEPEPEQEQKHEEEEDLDLL